MNSRFGFRGILRFWLAIMLVSWGAPGGVQAQDADEPEAITSGPAAGSGLTAVRCYATHGRHAGGEFDAAAELGDAPCAILFIHELTRNTAPVIRGLDDLANDYGILGFKSYTVALSGDRTAGEDLITRVNSSLNLSNPIVLSIDGAEGPGNFGLSRKPALTLVFAKGGKVRQSIALTDTGPNDVPKLEEWIKEVAGAMPGDDGLKALITKQLPKEDGELRELAAAQGMELRRLRAELRRRAQQGMRGGQPMQAGGVRERSRAEAGAEEPASGERQPPAGEGRREGGPPTDGQLVTLLRSFIRKTNGDEKSNDVFAEIEKRAAESEDLHGQVVEMFKLMLSFRDRYGTEHAQGLAEGFLKKAAEAESAKSTDKAP